MFGNDKDKNISEESVLEALSTVLEPELETDLVSLEMVKEVIISKSNVSITIMLTSAADARREQIERECRTAIAQRVEGVENVQVGFDSTIRADRRIADKLNIPVKNIIAVASGKGGVGKSTVSTNLAISWAIDGARVGVLDADIYGPNIPMMFGLSGHPTVTNQKMVPFVAHGVQVISMGFLMPEGEAIVWRGPMLHKAIQQLFVDVAWGELDYLIVDLPPGTGDAQLSLAQSVPMTGSIIVTQPQDVAISDARRGAAAFQKLEVPIIGVIENMSGEIFGTGGGQKAAQMMGTEFLGNIVLDPLVREGGDSGDPIVVAAPNGATSRSIRVLARKIAARINYMSLVPETELRIV